MSAQQRLLSRYTRDLKPGSLSWIGLRPGRKEDLIEVTEAMALQELGLVGDHRCDKTPGSARQVTLISEEYIQQTAHFLGVDNIKPNLLRRNLVVKNINLSALRHQKFSIGEAIFEATAICHPCTRMETALGKGAVAAMLGHGGLCAKILKTGSIKVGDTVSLIVQER